MPFTYFYFLLSFLKENLTTTWRQFLKLREIHRSVNLTIPKTVTDLEAVIKEEKQIYHFCHIVQQLKNNKNNCL